MTTRVQIEVIQEHMPVVIEVLRSDGSIQHTAMLSILGAHVAEYVHSGQMLRVREMTTAELHGSKE